jgi:hypothetical protein
MVVFEADTEVLLPKTPALEAKLAVVWAAEMFVVLVP